MTIEVTAKKADDAIKQGLVQLGAELDEVKVEVLESGGFFRKAKVRLTLERQEKIDTKKPVENQTTIAEAKKPEKPKETNREPRPTEKCGDSPVEQPTDKKNDGSAQPPKAAKTPAKKKPPRERANTVKAQEPRERTEKDGQAAEIAFVFVKEVVAKMGFDVTAEQSADGETVSLTARDGDDSLLIGRHGETLSALSFLAETCARAEKCHLKLTVDCNGYRDRRAASLAAMARRRADECVKKHRKIKLEPMERTDRRTVHSALTGDDRVTTASEGREPHRYVVILPKRENREV